MSEESPMCPICGGLHPAGHRDKELEDKLKAIEVGIIKTMEQVEDTIEALLELRMDMVMLKYQSSPTTAKRIEK